MLDVGMLDKLMTQDFDFKHYYCEYGKYEMKGLVDFVRDRVKALWLNGMLNTVEYYSDHRLMRGEMGGGMCMGSPYRSLRWISSFFSATLLLIRLCTGLKTFSVEKEIGHSRFLWVWFWIYRDPFILIIKSYINFIRVSHHHENPCLRPDEDEDEEIFKCPIIRSCFYFYFFFLFSGSLISSVTWNRVISPKYPYSPKPKNK